MQESVKRIYPDYLDYCKEHSNYLSPLITVAFDLTADSWEKYKKAYLKWARNKDTQEIAQIFLQLKKDLHITDLS